MPSTPTATESLLRDLAPQALGALARRRANFADAEDAVQEALVAAAHDWPEHGLPEQPLAWLVRVASRRMVDLHRSSEARRRREVLAASWSAQASEPAPAADDTLTLFFMCCHPVLSAPSAIALTLRAVGGLSTRDIARAFLVPEATMAQRISRAKAAIAGSGQPFELPSAAEHPERLRAVLHVLYLMFNEGYVSSSGPELVRTDLSGEAIRLTRLLRRSIPEDPELMGLLALMLLTDARRAARADASGALIPLAEQDRSRWDRRLITEGTVLATTALAAGPQGEYRAQAAIAALHDQAPSYEATDWAEIVALYEILASLAHNPIVLMNRAVAVAMKDGPAVGLDQLEALRPELGTHYRFHAVAAHLLEMAGHTEPARAAYAEAAAGTANEAERHYLVRRASGLPRHE